ncbi:MAG: transcriptional repressor LexA [Myxococcales bacterium]|nr:transcriptional repressor LexA [Myxococcales bacterium]
MKSGISKKRKGESAGRRRGPRGEMRTRIYHYVQQRLLAGDPPSVREIRDHVGLRATQTVQRHLDGLIVDGRLERDTSGRSRALRLPQPQPQPSLVPLLGRVQAGVLTTAIEDPEGFVPVSGVRVGDGLFALWIRGLSMEGAGILPGDVVIVRKQSDANDGDIVVALVDDEATVKRLRRRDGRVELHPENPDFDVIVPDSLTLLGKVVEVRRFLEGAPGGV